MSARERVALAELAVKPVEVNFCLKDKIYDSLKDAITSMKIYSDNAELRLDERKLAKQLRISRTPLREALVRLEQEGLVEIVPKKGVYIVRKSKVEILEMITVWAALEGMAARLISKNATDEEIAVLRHLVEPSETGEALAHIDEYSDKNITFHQTILSLSKNKLISDLAKNLFIHMQSIRMCTIGEEDRLNRSIVDHTHIVEALEKRQTALAEKLVREHTLNLAEHVNKHVTYLS